MRYLWILISALLLSCDQTDENLDDLFVAGENLSSASVLLGSWEVTSFIDEGENETRSFRNIQLRFENLDSLSILREDTFLVDGSWALIERGRVLDLQIPAFAGENEAFGEDLYELNDDWRVFQDADEIIRLVGDDEAIELTRIR